MMRTKRFSRSIEPSRFRFVIWGIGILLLLTLGLLLYLYLTVMQGKTETYPQSEKIAIEETPIEKVSTVYRYHGAARYDIVAGVESNGEEGFAFIPKSTSKQDTQQLETSYISRQNTISKDQILSQWRNECQGCEFIEITPAMDDQKPLWELTYMDAQNRYVFDYYYMKNAKKYEQFRLKQ